MPFEVLLTGDAARDLEELCDYIDRHDSPARADYVLERIEEAFQGLSDHPRRGSYPRELLDIGRERSATIPESHCRSRHGAVCAGAARARCGTPATMPAPPKRHRREHAKSRSGLVGVHTVRPGH